MEAKQPKIENNGFAYSVCLNKQKIHTTFKITLMHQKTKLCEVILNRSCFKMTFRNVSTEADSESIIHTLSLLCKHLNHGLCYWLTPFHRHRCVIRECGSVSPAHVDIPEDWTLCKQPPDRWRVRERVDLALWWASSRISTARSWRTLCGRCSSQSLIKRIIQAGGDQ